MTDIVLAAALVGGVGLVIGVLLGVAGEKFRVAVDEREAAVREALPGSNCGGCGFAGCDALAKAIVSGEAQPGACPVGGSAVAEKIAEIMGVESAAGEAIRRAALVRCGGTCDAAKEKYIYTGNMTCEEAANTTGEGGKACSYGCLGLGTCVSVCPFFAIRIENGVAVVDRQACTACGRCVEACPKHLIELVPCKAPHVVLCSSKDKGKDVMAVCQTGCVGCRICEKNCPEKAITVEDNVAKIDYEKCTGCGICAQKCPKKTIR